MSFGGRSSLKNEAKRFLLQITPSCERPLKFPSATLFLYWQAIRNKTTKKKLPTVHTAVAAACSWQCAMNKLVTCSQWQSEMIKIRMLLLPKGKWATNCCAIGIHRKMFSLCFLIANCGTRTSGHTAVVPMVQWILCPQLATVLLNQKLSKVALGKVTVSHKMQNRIRYKVPSPRPLIRPFWMTPLSGRSISLDGTTLQRKEAMNFSEQLDRYP